MNIAVCSSGVVLFHLQASARTALCSCDSWATAISEDSAKGATIRAICRDVTAEAANTQHVTAETVTT